MTTIRQATVEDAAAIGRVNVRAWQAAYRGELPDGYLDGLRAQDRAEVWAGWLARDHRADPVLVAEEAGTVIGFASVGPAEEPARFGQLSTIYVDPDRWGTGAGWALLVAAQTALAGLGYTHAVLWVLPGNHRARRFYERAGWTLDGARRTEEVWGVVVEEVRYRRLLRL
jgi:RimJ/RimL family protein N-acetyltransferase